MIDIALMIILGRTLLGPPKRPDLSFFRSDNGGGNVYTTKFGSRIKA